MTRERRRALFILAAALLAAAVFAIAAIRAGPSPLPARSPAERPRLLLLTSLPLLFGEDFSLHDGGSAALEKLQTRYRVVPISVTSPEELAGGRLLLMAQPRAQAAENLVALDDWVRRGGHVLLLADPMLEWPSRRPLGDLNRPPPMFMDTGLLAHWGVALEAPDRRGTVPRTLGRFTVATVSPGQLSGSCAISRDRLIARCRIGKGRATVVADADLLNAEALGKDASRNVDGVADELAALERH